MVDRPLTYFVVDDRSRAGSGDVALAIADNQRRPSGEIGDVANLHIHAGRRARGRGRARHVKGEAHGAEDAQVLQEARGQLHRTKHAQLASGQHAAGGKWPIVLLELIARALARAIGKGIVRLRVSGKLSSAISGRFCSCSRSRSSSFLIALSF
jgi:hypothetical protein